jgi:DHA2 family metal-tetracycline-proton antiporter-like MFS transporter
VSDPSVLALAACRFLTACCIATLMGYLPIYAARGGLGVGRAGLVITVSLLVSAALQRPLGMLADRMHRILLVVLGICVLGVSLGMVPLAGTFTLMFLLAVVIGLGRATTVAAAGALIATLGREHGAGSVMGFVNTAMSLGIGIGPLAAGICTDRFGLEWAFVAVGVAAIVGSVAAGAVLAARGGWRAESMTARGAMGMAENGG